jgi:hypothetical protein
MALELYKLDQYAHDLVAEYSQYSNEVTNQAHKMRSTVVYGLERFWGEHLRLDGEKADYWKETWDKFAEIVRSAGIQLPTDSDQDIQDTARELWGLPIEQKKVALAVLTQLCECMVWWTQRYKPIRNTENTNPNNLEEEE